MINLRPIVALLAALLLSCGGGALNIADTGGGVGTGGTGVVIGTVTGLGSVIVDGVRYDESHATLESQPDLVSAKSLALSDLHIGQYVQLTLDASGTPNRVRVQSQLVGPAGSVDPAASRLFVWGEQVLVNSDPAQGPITVFSGYSKLADVQPGDALQVYGALQASASGSDVLHATRIERISAGAVPARVSGTLQAASGGFLLEGRTLDVSAISPAPSLSAGEAVVAIVPWTSGTSGPWHASAVAPVATASSSGATISGAAHLLSSTAIEVQGQRVDVSSLSPAAQQQIREGGYVTVHVDADSKATAAEPQPSTGRAAQLRGSISSIAGAASFVLRGQAVDASNAQFTGGTAASLAVGLYVEVQGIQGVTGITATSVAIDAAPPDGAVVEVTGTVLAVDSSSRQVQLKLQGGSVITAVLPAQATLPKVGDTRQFEGYWQSGVLQVRDQGG